MSKVVAKPHGVLFPFSFFYFFLKHIPPHPLISTGTRKQCIRNIHYFIWNNIMYFKTKKEGIYLILHLYLNLAIRRATV